MKFNGKKYTGTGRAFLSLRGAWREDAGKGGEYTSEWYLPAKDEDGCEVYLVWRFAQTPGEEVGVDRLPWEDESRIVNMIDMRTANERDNIRCAGDRRYIATGGAYCLDRPFGTCEMEDTSEWYLPAEDEDGNEALLVYVSPEERREEKEYRPWHDDGNIVDVVRMNHIDAEFAAYDAAEAYGKKWILSIDSSEDLREAKRMSRAEFEMWIFDSRVFRPYIPRFAPYEECIAHMTRRQIEQWGKDGEYDLYEAAVLAAYEELKNIEIKDEDEEDEEEEE